VILWVTACSTQPEIPTVTATQTPRPIATSTAIWIQPTPFSTGDSIIWRDVSFTMDGVEVSNEFTTDFGSTRLPSSGNKFLWVHVKLKTLGTVEVNLPPLEHYSILYASTEIKPSYGHRGGYKDYTSLGITIFPDQELDGWLRFDIPAAAELKDMLFVFIPESTQIGASFFSPNYPYADDTLTYVWDLDQ
jgi:hypothetical protein